MFDDVQAPCEDRWLSGLRAARELLGGCVPAPCTAVLAEQIRVLEEVKSLTAAVQAEVTVSFVAGRRVEQAAAGVRAARVGLGIAQEVALARRESPFRAGRFIGFAHVLTRELPCTLAALRSGLTSEWRAMLVARETGWLSVEHRAVVDADLGPRLVEFNDRQVAAEAARQAYALDPHGKIRAIARAAGAGMSRCARHRRVCAGSTRRCRSPRVSPLTLRWSQQLMRRGPPGIRVAAGR